METEGVLACSHCSISTKETRGWKRCNKCAFLWCPSCASAENRCSNCIGGELISA